MKILLALLIGRFRRHMNRARITFAWPEGFETLNSSQNNKLQKCGAGLCMWKELVLRVLAQDTGHAERGLKAYRNCTRVRQCSGYSAVPYFDRFAADTMKIRDMLFALTLRGKQL
jgi:hypothetical protein